jgi:hypothetical protein
MLSKHFRTSAWMILFIPVHFLTSVIKEEVPTDGRKPYDTGRKKCSQMYSNTFATDRCTMRSTGEEIVIGRLSVELGFGKKTRRIGENWNVPLSNAHEISAKRSLDRPESVSRVIAGVINPGLDCMDS